MLPTDAKQRKDVPLYSGLVKYFPDALIEVAALSQIGNEQHNPGKPLHWDRSKSGDELDAMLRHTFDAGTRDTDKVRHSTKVAWRALANLQKEIEAERILAKKRDEDLNAGGVARREGQVSDWIPNVGAPASAHARVEVELRSGTRTIDEAGKFRWDDRSSGGDIIKWRYV